MARTDVDRRIDMPSPKLLTAREAASRLGIKRATLYTYVSRGLLARWPAEEGESLYLASEVEALRVRADAHKGHAAAAGGALRWGPPVIDSAVTSIDADGPNYRGQPALTLAERGVPWERVAELLWTGKLPSERPVWPEPFAPVDVPAAGALMRFPALVAMYAARGEAGDDLEIARRLARTLALDVSGGSAQGESIATLLATGWSRPEAAPDIDRALVLSADHELNASTFAARIAASAGADLLACLLAGFATMSGSRHGGSMARVERLVAEAALHGPSAAVTAWEAAGDVIPGVGHPLYPAGDPRGELLLALARSAGAGPALALADHLAALGHAPNLDLGLVALTSAWGLPSGSAGALFAIGRTAGWVAHVLEQRESDGLLRPRAHYTGA